MSYIGTLLLEHAHNHPVLRVFCHILVSEANRKEKQSPPANRVLCKQDCTAAKVVPIEMEGE